MSKYRKLTHVFYKSDYHIMFTPKYCYRILDGLKKPILEHDIQQISSWKEVIIHELMFKKTIFIWYVPYLRNYLFQNTWAF